MGLKVAKFLKKNISFKNAVKLAGSAVPGIGGSVIQGLQASHQAKKAARDEKAIEVANEMAYNAGSTAGNYAGTVAGNAWNGAVKSALSKSSDAFDQTTGMVVAKVVDNTIKEWFKMHWIKLVVAVATLVTVWHLFIRKKKRSKW